MVRVALNARYLRYDGRGARLFAYEQVIRIWLTPFNSTAFFSTMMSLRRLPELSVTVFGLVSLSFLSHKSAAFYGWGFVERYSKASAVSRLP